MFFYKARYGNNINLSLFQNSVSFEKGFRKTFLKAGFSAKSKVAFPKTEVLEKPHLTENFDPVSSQFFGFSQGNIRVFFEFFRCTGMSWRNCYTDAGSCHY